MSNLPVAEKNKSFMLLVALPHIAWSHGYELMGIAFFWCRLYTRQHPSIYIAIDMSMLALQMPDYLDLHVLLCWNFRAVLY